MAIENISPRELQARCEKRGAVDLIDVRTPAEFREVHLEIARNVPLNQLDADTLREQRNGSHDEPLYVICQQGGRSTQACQQLEAAGFTNLVNVEGGTVACDAAGLAMVRGRKTISLERQVRIAAGFLVVLGVGLGWFVHPAFFALSAFVGAGLMFAGITDTCGMGMLLARMPWNQVSSDNGNQQCCT